jgi:ABC-type lipoprotein release transport system permease subunit
VLYALLGALLGTLLGTLLGALLGALIRALTVRIAWARNIARGRAVELFRG